MELKFTEMCACTMTCDRQNLFHKLNGIDTFDYSSYGNKVLSKKFYTCLNYVGGFVDSYYWNKRIIENLSLEEQKELFNELGSHNEL
jgi:hypothetical protein